MEDNNFRKYFLFLFIFYINLNWIFNKLLLPIVFNQINVTTYKEV